MKIAVIGTGEVGSTLGGKLAQLGHEVTFGSRHPKGDDATKLSERTGATVASHADAVAAAELVINAIHGENTVETLQGTPIAGKLLMDVGNYQSAIEEPVERTLAETLQREFPDTRVVKTLNNISANLMIDPKSLGGPSTVFIAGDDSAAKSTVTDILKAFGWESIVDLGDLTAARAMEELVPLWMKLFKKLGHTNFNLHLHTKP